MSVQQVVFVPRASRLPSPADWSTAAVALGFDLEFPHPFDPLTHSGGLPVRCGGIEAAFEYYCDGIADYLEEVGGDFSLARRIRLRFSRFAVGFVTHSRLDDYFTAAVAAGSLSYAVRGLHLDCTSGRFTPWRDSPGWLARTIRLPSPEAVQQRARIAEAVHEWTASELAALGYHALEQSPSPYADRNDRWFARGGRIFPTELVEASVYADSDESFLSVTFFACRVALEQLTAENFWDNVAGRDLFHAISETGRSYEEMLPKNIPLEDGFTASETARRLRGELRQADGVVFGSLAERLAEDEEW